MIYKEFTVRDLFTKKTMKGYPKSKENLTPNENGFYVYGQNIKHQYDFSEGNNSIAGYVDFDTEQIEEGNCISIGGKTMVVTYQSKDYVSNDSHNLALYIDDIRGRTEKAQLFIVSAIKSALSHKYTWGDSISKSKIKSDKIMLPVTDSGNIDFEYMEEYITAIEKTVMGNVLNVINNETSTQ